MTQRLFHLPIGVNPIAAAMPHLVYLLLGIHVAGKVICKQEPVIALGHVIDIVHQALEVLSFTKGAISDAAQQLQESVSVSRPHKGWTQVQDQSLMHS